MSDDVAGAPASVPAAPLDRGHFRALIAERSSRARSRSASLGLEIREITLAHRDTPADDEHDPEGSTVSLERERDVALLAASLEQAAELQAALARLDGGTFGICEGCGGPIAAARLEARPEARLCLPCQVRAAAH
jgi:RNA polymerase-binding transcription factor DksA